MFKCIVRENIEENKYLIKIICINLLKNIHYSVTPVAILSSLVLDATLHFYGETSFLSVSCRAQVNTLLMQTCASSCTRA